MQRFTGAAQPSSAFLCPLRQAVHERPKARAVIVLDQMGDFMSDDVIEDEFRC